MATKFRSASAGYPRGEETKQRIIDAAIEIFGREGFAGTSTRDIAAAATVNTPAIQYYFDGKLGLYNACVDQLTGTVWRRISPAVRACEDSFASPAGADAVAACLCELQNALIDSFFADSEGSAIRRLLAWEDAENDEGNSSHEFMKERIGLPVFGTFRRAVERVAPGRMTRMEVEMHALSLMGISMIFHFNQCRVMDMLNWEMDDRLIANLKAVAHKQMTFALAGLARPDSII